MDLEIRPTRWFRPLLWLFGLIVLAHLGTLFSIHVLGRVSLGGLVPLFGLGEEGNIPTWFSSLLLGSAALACLGAAILSRSAGRAFAKTWVFLGVLFVFLSADEASQIHELTVAPLRRVHQSQFLRYIGWVLPYAALALLLSLVLLRFWWRLPAKTRILTALSAVLYVFGAIGMELITGYYSRNVPGRPLLPLFVAAEEILEMVGVGTFLFAVLDFIETEFGPLSLRLRSRGGAA